MSIIEQIRAYVESRKKTAETFRERDICIDIIEVIDYIQEKSEKPINPVSEKKSNIVEDLKHYLATTPKERQIKDWEELKEWGKVGPLVSEFLEREQPVCEDLEEEIERYIPTSLAVKFPTTDIETIKSDIRYIARHFYELGRQSKPKVSEDVKTEAKNHRSTSNYHGDINLAMEDSFIKGATWQKEQDDKELSEKIAGAYQLGRKDEKEQMMKEAVEGIAVINANAKEDGFGYVRSGYVADAVLRGLGNFKLIIVKEEGK